MLENLNAGGVSKRQFNTFSTQLARALGIIPSSEKRKSGDPLGSLKVGAAGGAKNERERLEERRDRSDALADRHAALKTKHDTHCDRLNERLKKMDDESVRQQQETDSNIPVEEIELSAQAQAQASKEAAELVNHLEIGRDEDPDPALQSSVETLMNSSVVSTAELQLDLDVELPDGVDEENVVKTMSDTRVRYDFSVAVTRVELNVEKKVVVDKDGTRQIFSASTSEFGPPRYAVTWQALATLAVLIGQFAMPFNRLATMLTTAAKRFTTSSLSRMAHYVAVRLTPVYLALCDEISDSEILAGDDTSCRVVEVSSYLSHLSKHGEKEDSPPWAGFRNTQEAEQSHEVFQQMREALLQDREEGYRQAKRTPLDEPSLSLLVGRELDFESQRRNGKGGKQSLNTTVVTGRSVADDPQSMIVFYRSHLGSFGNILEMLLRRRNAKARKVIVQSDLSTTNLVGDAELTRRFEIEYCGCLAHARRPFALYEDQDPDRAPYMLHLFKGLALHEHLLDCHGRKTENVVAVRTADSSATWEDILKLAKSMKSYWSKATPLGIAARYIIKHFKKLTAYLNNPRIEPTNNLRERLLRTEKLIEKSSLFRRTIEGRVVLDVLRTILQTAVAAGVPTQEYLIDVLKADPNDVSSRPEHYTPRAWARRQRS